MPVAKALASGHVMALSMAILANIDQCLTEASVGKIDSHQNGLLGLLTLVACLFFQH